MVVATVTPMDYLSVDNARGLHTGETGMGSVSTSSTITMHDSANALVEFNDQKAFLAWDQSIEDDELGMLHTMLIDNGYTVITDQYYDIDWQRNCCWASKEDTA